jgi:hypothetical protein
MSRKQNKQKSKMVPVVRKVLERSLLVLLVIVCIGAFYLAVILAEVPADQGAPAESSVPQVALTAEQPRQIGSLNDLKQLVEHFPSPVLALQANTQLAFAGGLVNDLAYKGSFARLVTLTYQTQNGETLKLYSIYPLDAFTLLPGENYSLQNTLTASLAGMTAVRMENADTLRLHVKGESALYALTSPKMEEEALSEISRQAILVMP